MESSYIFFTLLSRTSFVLHSWLKSRTSEAFLHYYWRLISGLLYQWLKNPVPSSISWVRTFAFLPSWLLAGKPRARLARSDSLCPTSPSHSVSPTRWATSHFSGLGQMSGREEGGREGPVEQYIALATCASLVGGCSVPVLSAMAPLPHLVMRHSSSVLGFSELFLLCLPPHPS